MKKITKLLVTVIFCLGVAFTAVTPAFAAVAKVNNLKAAVTATTVTLTWNKVSGATGYKVYQQYGSKWKVIALPKTNKQVVKKLTSGVTYKFCVRAFKGSGKKAQYGKLSPVVSARPVCIAPKTVTATPVSPTAVKLSWSSLSSAKGYLIQKYDEASKAWVKAASTTSTTVTVSGLKTNVAVKFRVRGYTQVKGKNVYGYAKAVTVTPDLKAPTGIKSAVLSSTSAKLSWNAVGGAKGYAVQKYNTSTKKWNHVAFSGSATNYTVTNLIPTVENRLRVVAYVVQDGKNVYGKASSYASVKPSIAKPTGLSHGASDSTTVELSWKAVSGATGYNVYAKSAADKNYVLVATSTGAGCIVKNLKSDTEYTFAVKAFITASDKKSYSSASSNTTTWKTAPAPVSGLSATRFTDNLIQLSWTGSPDAESISRYELFAYVHTKNYDGSDKYEWVSQGTFPTTKTSCDVSKITYKNENGETVSLEIEQKTDYQFKLQGYSIYRYHPENSDNPDAIETEYLYSTAALYTATTGLSRVKNLKVETPTSSSLNVSWTKNDRADSYKLEMSKDNKTWEEVDLSKQTKVENDSISTVCYTIGGLEASTTYYFRVTAITSATPAITSPVSDVASAKTTPASITDLTYNNVKDTSLSLSWKPVEGAVKYEIFWLDGAKDNADWELLKETTETTFSKNELSQLTTYKFKVRAYTEGVSVPSDFSNEVSVTTALGKIQNLTFYTSNSNSIELRWTANGKAASYKLEFSKDNKTWEEYKPEKPITNQSGTSYVSVIYDKMTPSTEIYFRVTVINGEISSDYSNVVHAKTAPAPVEDVKAEPSDTSIALTWKKDSSVSNYIVQFRKKGASDWTSSTEAAAAIFGTIELDNKNAKATIKGLTQFTDYEIQVSSYNAFESKRLSSTPTGIEVKTLLSAVTGLEVVSATETEINLRWNTSSKATSYSLQASDNGSTGWSDSKSTTIDSSNGTAKVSGLSASKAKYFRVFANNGTTSSVASTIVCGMTAPKAVKDIVATATSDTTVRLTWSCDSSATEYVVSVDGKAVKTVKEKSATIEGLKAGTKYTFAVMARNQNGAKYIEAAKVEKKATTLLGKVQNVEVTNATKTSISLKWNAVTGANSYSITVDGKTYTSNTNSYTINSLNPGKEYTVRIVATKDELSGVATDKTAKTVPGAITVEVPIGNITDKSILLKITHSYKIDGYKYSLNNSDWKNFTGTTPIISDLNSGEKYKIKVKAYVTNDGKTYESDDIAEVEATTYLKGTNPLLSSVSKTSVAIAWSKNPDAKSFTITYKEKADSTGKETKITVNNDSGEVSFKVIEGLKAGTEYTFTIVANGKDAESAPSTVTAKTIPTSIKNFKATTNNSNTDIVLSWDKISVASKYEIYDGEKKIGESSTTSYTVKGAAQGSKHDYSIKAVVGNANISAETSGTLATTTVIATVFPIKSATAVRTGNEIKITLSEKLPSEATVIVCNASGKVYDDIGVLGNEITVRNVSATETKFSISVIIGLGESEKITIDVPAAKAA
ncbi:MAG: fibronectin type III domain-containing protein [Clostridia bacterium]|nr:fibronectin type III domain-containing protein [Clostridia bacterium]